MDSNKIIIKMTLELDKTWASNHAKDELLEFIRDKVNTSLGFRGEVKRFNAVSK